MSSEFIRIGYTWAEGSRITADADAVVRDLEAIERETGSNGVSLDAMVLRAKMPESPLYALMEHDTERAAYERNLDEMAQVLRSVRHRLVNRRTEEEQIGPRAYHPVRTVTDDRGRPGVYLRVAMVPEPPRHTPPLAFVVETTRPAPAAQPVVAEAWRQLPAPHSHDTGAGESPQPAELPHLSPERVVRLTESRERARAVLLRWAETLERDPYFDGVVAAIRALA